MLRWLPISLFAFIGCRQVYEPPVVAHPPDYLVVEGSIEDNGSDSTYFTLSRTVQLDSNSFIPEVGAEVDVEGSDNTSFTLGETGAGKYGAVLAGLHPNATYRLHILTAAGKQYASDYVPLVYNPPIDSINWVKEDNEVHQGVQIYANTHNPQNNTHFYRWQYQECWVFASPFRSYYNYVPGQGVIVVYPMPDDTCWRYNSSGDILLANSSQLSQDVIYEQPIVLIPLNSQQISIRYSILVTQYALTGDAFKWWQILQKNTEKIGSIFGVQPSANPGNIHCLSDSNELVLGYVGACNSRSQRIFITHSQAQPWDYSSGCYDDTTIHTDFNTAYLQGYLPWWVPIGPPQFNPVHFSSIECIDCTKTGSNIRPSFW